MMLAARRLITVSCLFFYVFIADGLRLEMAEKFPLRIDCIAGEQNPITEDSGSPEAKRRKLSSDPATRDSAKLNESTCCKCRVLMKEGDLQISATVNSQGQTEYLHLECFSKVRKNYQFRSSGDTLPGYEELKPANKRKVNKILVKIRDRNKAPPLSGPGLDDKAKSSDLQVAGKSSPSKTSQELNEMSLDKSEINQSNSDFAIISLLPNWVDKTRLIVAVEAIRSDVILVTAPRRWGKTSAVSSLKRYYQIQVDPRSGKKRTKVDFPPNTEDNPIDNPVDYTIIKDTSNYALFEGTLLDLQEPLSMKHLGKYPVISVDFKGDVDNDDALANCRDAIRNAYREHWYLETSTKLEKQDPGMITRIKKWCGIESYRNMGWDDVVTSIQDLSEMLSIHWGRKCVILIDEYDAMTMNCLSSKDSEIDKEFRKMQKKLNRMLVKALKGNKYLYKGFITGISYVAGIWSGLNNLNKCRFSGSHKFNKHYGLSQQEVDELLNDNQLLDVSEKVAAHYNGYVAYDREIGDEMKYYCTWSIMNYLDDNIKKPRSHWCESGFVYLLYESFASPKMREIIYKLINGEVIEVNVSTLFRDVDFENVKKFANHPETAYFRELILTMFLEQGCLTAAETLEERMELLNDDDDNDNEPDSKPRKLKIPNEEIRSHFRQELRRYITTVYSALADEIDALKESFDQILKVMESPDKLRTAFKKFTEDMEPLIKAKYGDAKDISLLSSGEIICLLVAATFSRCPKFFIEFNVKNILQVADGGRIDYCSTCQWQGKKIATILEVKINDSTEKAQEQIITKRYFRVLDHENFKNPHEVIFMCLNVNRSRKSKEIPWEISLSYTLRGDSPHTEEALARKNWETIKLPESE